MGGNGCSAKKKSQMLTIETYLDFIGSNKQLDLTVANLNQIINIHGFKRFNMVPKKDLLDAMKTMELMDLKRSTLQEKSMSSEAFISLDEVIEDLTSLNWQECCATSLQTICFSNGDKDLADHSKEQTNASASGMPTIQPQVIEINDGMGQAAHGIEIGDRDSADHSKASTKASASPVLNILTQLMKEKDGVGKAVDDVQIGTVEAVQGVTEAVEVSKKGSGKTPLSQYMRPPPSRKRVRPWKMRPKCDSLA